jgi:hypothetical protein
LDCFVLFIRLLSIIMWSAVAALFWPSACVSVIVISVFILWVKSLSNSFRKLLASVIPLSLLHFPFSPFPLYSLLISPLLPLLWHLFFSVHSVKGF